MAVLTIPSYDAEPWPTLGPLVCDFIESYLVFGPGDLLGQSARLDDEKRMFIWRMYEIWPDDSEFPGRRRFDRVALSLPKGCAKTELAAWIAAAELHPLAPVRFDGWDGQGMPRGRPVRDPYIPMFAYTEEQTELLAYGALKAILEESPAGQAFDIGLQRILRIQGDGKCEARASSPNSADGARTTFAHLDETHRFTLYHHKELHTVNLGNVSKREAAGGWSLETTTAPEPGAGSVAEETMDYAASVLAGAAQARSLFFYHRQASEDADLTTEGGARAALEEAYGPAAPWANIEAKMNLWWDPQYPRGQWARFFANLKVKSEARAFDLDQFKSLANPRHEIPKGALVTLGFDGGFYHDSTGIVVTEVETGFQHVLDVWEQPYGPAGKDWQVPDREVDDAIKFCFQTWSVWRGYFDPEYWKGWLVHWAGLYGADKIIEFYTNKPLKMSQLIRDYQMAIQTGDLSHDGHEAFTRHIGNAFRQELKQRDDQDRPLYYIHKERSDSPFKMDLAMCGILSWAAREDAIKAGATKVPGPGIWV